MLTFSTRRPIKHGQYLLKQGHFPIKHGHFSINFTRSLFNQAPERVNPLILQFMRRIASGEMPADGVEELEAAVLGFG